MTDPKAVNNVHAPSGAGEACSNAGQVSDNTVVDASFVEKALSQHLRNYVNHTDVLGAYSQIQMFISSRLFSAPHAPMVREVIQNLDRPSLEALKHLLEARFVDARVIHSPIPEDAQDSWKSFGFKVPLGLGAQDLSCVWEHLEQIKQRLN